MKRKMKHVVTAALLLTTITACTKDDKSPVADTLESIDTLKPIEPAVSDSAVDSSRIQNPSAPAPPGAPKGALPPPGGETYRRGSSTMAPRDPAPPNDPPPNIIGEQRRQGSSTMSPRQRDSTVGPRMEIDPQGRVTPIKK